jgi:hypothetical protein
MIMLYPCSCRRMLSVLGPGAIVLLAALALAGLAAVPARASYGTPSDVQPPVCDPCPPPFDLPPRTVLCNGPTEAESTIKVEIATTGSENVPNGWGGIITGIFYRSSPSPDPMTWGTNMIDNSDYGRDLQATLRAGPMSSGLRWGCEGMQYQFSDDEEHYPEVNCHPDPPDYEAIQIWNPTQGGGRAEEPYPACACVPDCDPDWETGESWGWIIEDHGGESIPWVKIGAYPRDTSCTAVEPECVQLEQTIHLYPEYIKVEYSIFERAGNECPIGQHPVGLWESPAVFAWPGDVCNPNDPSRLKIKRVYDGVTPWENDDLTTPQPYPEGALAAQVFPSEQWIGLYRPADNYGLTLAYPVRPLHQPYPSFWGLQLNEECFTVMWARFFRHFYHGISDTVSWTLYVIPGTVEDGRRVAYALLPHRNWEFEIDGSREGWCPGGQIAIHGVEGGVLKARAIQANPRILSLPELDFASDSISGVQIRLAVTAGTQGKVEYITEEEAVWKGKTFNIIAADGQFYTYYVQLDDITGWGGKTISRFRVRPTNAPTGTEGIKIDYIRALTKPAWEFNAEGNNEGWQPVTAALREPPWPGHVTAGKLSLRTTGITTDPYTEPTTDIIPTLLGPYPISIHSGPRSVELKIKFSGGGPATRGVRLWYTFVYDPKVFDYHAYYGTVILPEPWPDSEWPHYKLVTRFDVAGHAPVEQSGLRPNRWHEVSLPLPNGGTIDQLMLEFITEHPGTVEIDYIRAEYGP